MPLDVFIVRKLSVPGFGVPVAYEVAKRQGVEPNFFKPAGSGAATCEELAVGAIASGGVRVLNEDVMRALPNADETIESITARETAELERREQSYRNGRPAPELRDRIVILVDDGLATGATMRAAAKIVVAVPVGPPDTCREFEDEADETICASTPEFFRRSVNITKTSPKRVTKKCAICSAALQKRTHN